MTWQINFFQRYTLLMTNQYLLSKPSVRSSTCLSVRSNCLSVCLSAWLLMTDWFNCVLLIKCKWEFSRVLNQYSCDRWIKQVPPVQDTVRCVELFCRIDFELRILAATSFYPNEKQHAIHHCIGWAIIDFIQK